MSSPADFLKVLFKQLRDESAAFVVTAARNSARAASQQMREAVRDLNQPSDEILSKLLTAVKESVITTGQEMVIAGLDRIEGASSTSTPSTARLSVVSGKSDSSGSTPSS